MARQILEHPFLAELVRLARQLGYEVAISADEIDNPVEIGGVTLFERGQIHLVPGRGALDYFQILTHELAHVLLHNDRSLREQTTRLQRESEADAVVRLVLDARAALGDPHLSSLRTHLAPVFEPNHQIVEAAQMIIACLPPGYFYGFPA